MRLDVWNGDLIVIEDPPTAVEYDKYGKREPIQIGFSYKDGTWKQMKFGETPKEIHDTNLAINHRLPAGTAVLSLSEKERHQFNGDPHLSKGSKTIVPKRSNFYRGGS